MASAGDQGLLGLALDDAVDAVADRIIIYPGSLLHSGIIPREMNFSADPREGRLTANLFVRAH